MEVLKLENLKGIFYRIDSTLSNVEVKGDSVQHLMLARNSLKELFSLIEEVQEEETENKKEE